MLSCVRVRPFSPHARPRSMLTSPDASVVPCESWIHRNSRCPRSEVVRYAFSVTSAPSSCYPHLICAVGPSHIQSQVILTPLSSLTSCSRSAHKNSRDAVGLSAAKKPFVSLCRRFYRLWGPQGDEDREEREREPQPKFALKVLVPGITAGCLIGKVSFSFLLVPACLQPCLVFFCSHEPWSILSYRMPVVCASLGVFAACLLMGP